MVCITKPFRIVELYAGTARSAEPFKAWKRSEIASLIDSSTLARKTYLANFPNAPYSKRSLVWMRPNEIISAAGGKIDILLGCPPCQGFSESGKRDPDDPRNSHMSRFAKVIRAAKPKAIALENVPMAASSAEYDYLVATLDELGYQRASMIANAVQYGSCQTRQRLILIAFRKDLQVVPIFPEPTHGGNKRVFSYSSNTYRSIRKHSLEMLGMAPSTQRLARHKVVPWSDKLGDHPSMTVWDCIGDLQNISMEEAQELHHLPWSHSNSILKRMAKIPEGGQWSGSKDYFSHSYGRLHRRGFAKTITGNFSYAGCGRYWHPIENRALTLREAARIQGIPDSFKFLEQSRASAMLVGNGLDSVFSSMCYDVIRSALE